MRKLPSEMPIDALQENSLHLSQLSQPRSSSPVAQLTSASTSELPSAITQGIPDAQWLCPQEAPKSCSNDAGHCSAAFGALFMPA